LRDFNRSLMYPTYQITDSRSMSVLCEAGLMDQGRTSIHENVRNAITSKAVRDLINATQQDKIS